MSFLHGWRERAKQLLRRGELDRELEEELAFHLEQDRLLRESAGVPPADALREARLRFGSSERFREEVRETWTGALLFGVRQDVRLGVRRLLQRPAFSIVALCTLALGIGANTAMFSVVRSVLLDPFPYGDPDDLVLVWDASGSQADETWLSARELVEYRAATRSFASLAGYTRFSANLTGDLEPERVRAAAVTGDMFSTLDVGAARGRTFTRVEDTPGSDDVVVLGHGLWQRRFGGGDMVGATIEVNGQPRRVVGVMPAGFQLPLDYRDERPSELWVPAAIDPADDLPWGSRSWYLVGRLAAGVTPALATDDLQRVMRIWEGEGYVTNADGRLDRAAFPLDTLLLRGVRPALLILFGSVGFILLIACANVMHLLLARADTRRREVATQAALGASRARIVRQLVIESGVLAVCGAALGLLLAWVAVRAAPALVPVNIIRAREITVDGAVLGFTALLALGTTVLAGMAPALQLVRLNVAHTMASSRGDVAPLRRGVRRSLIVLETALSLVLVIGAALLARSFLEMRRIDLGFDPAGVLTLRIQLPAAEYDDARTTQFYATLLDRVRDLPGVESVAAVRVLPLTETIGDWSITLDGRPYMAEENPNGDWQVATADYLETMRIPLLAGRYPTRAEGPDTPPVAVINRAMADRYWPGEDVLGRRFHLGTLDQPWIEIIGVIPNVRHNAVIEDAREEMVLLHSQFMNATGRRSSPVRGMTLVVRTTGEPLAMAPPVRDVIRQLDPRLPVADVRTLDHVAAAALAQPRFTALLLTSFALLALLLAGIGLYGVISFMAARRTNELGVRLALGARPRDIIAMVMSEGVVLAGAGVLIGITAAALLTRFVRTQLFGVAPLDPATFLIAPVLLLAVAALATYLPARRAASISPVAALSAD